jgi:hypothetical protein
MLYFESFLDTSGLLGIPGSIINMKPVIALLGAAIHKCSCDSFFPCTSWPESALCDPMMDKYKPPNFDLLV